MSITPGCTELNHNYLLFSLVNIYAKQYVRTQEIDRRQDKYYMNIYVKQYVRTQEIDRRQDKYYMNIYAKQYVRTQEIDRRQDKYYMNIYGFLDLLKEYVLSF